MDILARLAIIDMKLSNDNLTLSDKIDLADELIREYEIVQDKILNYEMLLIKAGEIDEWRQLRINNKPLKDFFMQNFRDLLDMKNEFLKEREDIMNKNLERLVNGQMI